MSQDTKKKITIKEFKMWLQGVEEMQDADWVPSASQWKRIREKINDINDQPAPAPAPAAPTYVPAPAFAQPAPVYPTNPGIPAGPSPLATNPAPVGPSAPPGPPPAGAPFFSNESAAMPVKTPTIDTSNGQYKSSFA